MFVAALTATAAVPASAAGRQAFTKTNKQTTNAKRGA